MLLQVGSNVVRNPDGIVRADGVELMRLECGEDGQLLLSLDVYDGAGAHVGRLWRNAWAFHDEALTRVATEPGKLMLAEAGSGKPLLEVDIVGVDTIRIARAAYYDGAGRQIVVAGDEWRIGDAPVITGRDIDGQDGVDVAP